MISGLNSNAQLYQMPYAVLDFETTGLGTDARVVSAAVVVGTLGENKPTVAFNERFNPGCPIPEEATAIHGICDADVSDCPSFAERIPALLETISDRVLCVYNLPYDWGMLNAELKLAGHELIPWSGVGICVLVLARYVDAGERGKGVHKLESVAKRRGIEFSAHDARADALATASLLNPLLRSAVSKRGELFSTCRDYWAWQRCEAIGQEMNLRRYLQTKGIERDVWPWMDY